MKIKVKLPRKWSEVTWSQALQLIDAKDEADKISVFANLKPETLRKAHISNLDELLSALAFTNEILQADILPKSILGYEIPKDLNFQSVCRYEDVKSYGKQIFDNHQKGDPITSETLKDYHKIVAVYAMPDYEDATPQQREEFEKKFFNAPCTEVMAVGNFTLLKLKGLKQQGPALFPILGILTHRLKLVLGVWRSKLAFWLRFAIWKNKHRIGETNY